MAFKAAQAIQDRWCAVQTVLNPPANADGDPADKEPRKLFLTVWSLKPSVSQARFFWPKTHSEGVDLESESQ
ncbi:MAG: hypothetical protein EBT49_04950 [Betaproteobacteria bacterium]|nr:hypothetical protein [Betaproteobacteria bacterium]